MTVSSLPAKQRRTRLRIKALRRLWEFCQGVTSTVVSDWRLVIGKLGRFSRHELRGIFKIKYILLFILIALSRYFT